MLILSLFTTDKYSIRLSSGGLVEITIADECELDACDIQAIHEAKMRMVGEMPHCVLLKAGRYSTVTREAQELSQSREMGRNRIAKAIVIHSLAHRIIGNFFLSRHRTGSKVRLFTCEMQAREWLQNITVA